jgi:hypothetical protein
VAQVPAGTPTDYPLDAANYIKDFWGEGRDATYADFPLLGGGPFGEAIRIRKEEDLSFRPFLFVPRSRLHDTPLDIKGAGRSVTVVVWAIRESGNHALAGIWHEGTDLKEKTTEGIRKVERGQRQYALFAGLNKEGAACGHVSENGASSFQNRYALHKCNSAAVAAPVPADAPPATAGSTIHRRTACSRSRPTPGCRAACDGRRASSRAKIPRFLRSSATSRRKTRPWRSRSSAKLQTSGWNCANIPSRRCG